jgi:hypothetical protein
VGATAVVNGSYSPSNPSASSFSDQVTVVAQPVGSQTTQSFGPFFATCSRGAAIAVNKTCRATQVVLPNGNLEIRVLFDVVIRNIGTVPFESISVTENTGQSLQPLSAAALPVGATTTLSSSYTPSDQNALSFTDTVTVFAVPTGSDQAISQTASATCSTPTRITSTTAPRGALVDISKTCTVGTDSSGHTIVSFEITVSNSGTVPFATLVVFDAENITQAATQNFVISSGLEVGASTQIQSSYRPSDQNANTFTDVVTVLATPRGTSQNPNPLPIEFGPRFATCSRPVRTPVGRQAQEEQEDQNEHF